MLAGKSVTSTTCIETRSWSNLGLFIDAIMIQFLFTSSWAAADKLHAGILHPNLSHPEY